MSLTHFKRLRLSESDLDFLVETASPEVADKTKLKHILREDEDFRVSFVGDEKVFTRVMDDEEIFLKISPHLFFEILLRKASQDLAELGYTLEKNRSMSIPVFDTKDVVELMTKDTLLLYLADMLSSFMKTQNYAISFRAQEGMWHKIRFSDLDIHSLMSFCGAVGEEQRFALYKRIADICLFILGMFPEYAERDYRYPFSGQLRPQLRGRLRISPEDYEKEGRKFYQLAAEHHSAKELELSEIFWVLHESFEKARKPLNFISAHYLQYSKHRFFG